ncbi:MAG: poly(A) polymerase [Desulfomicrobiaceae bacterium]|jgi:poly(A) polymerase|nr:poly(A) polymerase [Desulfomicrobiaceae bacterium]
MQIESESFTQPRIIPRSEHPISRKNIHPDALKVMYRLVHHGFLAYLVGGSVRDLILGRPPKDFDVGTNATPNQVKRLFKNCFLVGRRFRLAHIRFGEHVVETATFRRTPDVDEDGDVCLVEDNCFGTPEEDALRRDFTINALFYNIKDFSVIDHVGGLEDLHARVVRAIGDPNLRFQEDPVRMLRAVRFASRLGFHIEPATYHAILTHHQQILRAPVPRLFDELLRLFAYGSAEAAFRLLYKTGLLHDLIPEIADFLDHDHGQDSRLWAWLAALDATVVASPERGTPAVNLAVLLAPAIAWVEERYRRAGEVVQYAALVRDLAAPVLVRLGAPRWLQDRVVMVLQYQKRFDPLARKRFSKRGFLAQAAFPETLTVFEVASRCGHGEEEVLRAWQEMAQSAHLPAPRPEKPARRKRRGRRPRRAGVRPA